MSYVSILFGKRDSNQSPVLSPVNLTLAIKSNIRKLGKSDNFSGFFFDARFPVAGENIVGP